MADAMDRIELLEEVVGRHVEKFDLHVTKQQEFNEKITERVVVAEKADIAISGKLDVTTAKLDTIIDQLSNKRIGWQIWLPFSVTAVMSFAALVIQIWPKGVTP